MFRLLLQNNTQGTVYGAFHNVLRGHVAMAGRTQYVPPLPRDLADQKAWIIAAVKNIDASLLTRVWQELEYRVDVCRVTRGAHIEHI
jgi:hypothetical protein